jgi:cysteine synthase
MHLTVVTGNTPLMRINSLSDALGVEILGKAEVRYLLPQSPVSRD